MAIKEDKKVKLAIFDIDGTIFRSSLFIELINVLVADDVFPSVAQNEIQEDYTAWLNRKGSYEAYLEQVVKIYNKNIIGCKEEDIRRVVDKVLLSEKEKIYRFTSDLVKKMKDEGYLLMAISGSPDFIVSKFTDYMGFDVCRGSVFEVKDGYFTGNTLNIDSLKNKKSVIDKFVKESKFDVDLENSMAVGDSGPDIPMLETVGNPIAFNPDGVLAKHAREKGWTVVVERKNVIYKIKDFDISSY